MNRRVGAGGAGIGKGLKYFNSKAHLAKEILKRAEMPRVEVVRVGFHHWQAYVLNSTKRFICMIAGKRGGKSYVGAHWLFKQVADDPMSDYLITAPTYKILRQASLPMFKDVIKGTGIEGKWSEQRSEFNIKNGGIIYVRSTDDPDSIESMNCKAIWADELGKMKWVVWDKFEQRVSQKKGYILGTTSWYGQNWLYHEIYKKRINLPEYEVVTFKTSDNPWFPRDEYERLRALHTDIKSGKVSDLFLRDFDAVCTRNEGLVFSQFARERNVVEPFVVSKEWARFNGMDIGYNSPTALVFCAVEPLTGDIYIYDEYYESKKSLEYCATELKMRGQGQTETYADRTSAQEIFELNNMGLRIFPYKNINGTTNKDNKNIGNDRLNLMFMKGQIKVFSTCKRTIDECESYSYKENNEFNDARDEVVKSHDHLCDGLRYGIISSKFADKKRMESCVSYSPEIEYDDVGGVLGYKNDGKPDEMRAWLDGNIQAQKIKVALC